MIYTIKFKRGSNAEVVASTYVPEQGEPIAEIEQGNTRLKIGDGVTMVRNLPYIGDPIYVDTTPVTEDHGGVSKGEVLAGEKVSDILEKILTKYQIVSVSTLTTDLSDYEVGYEATGNVEVGYAIDNSENAVSGLLTSPENMIAQTPINVQANTITVPLTGYSRNTIGSASINLEVIGAQAETANRSVDTYWKGKIYYGYRTTKTLLTETQIEGLVSNVLQDTAVGTYAIDPGYGYICIPDIMALPGLNQFFDPDTDFMFDMEHLGNVSVNNGKITLNYGVYVTTNYLNGNFNIDIR
jgi:hypothetical protein